jgi:hypothetical protein
LAKIYEALAPAEQQLGWRVNPTLHIAAKFRRRRKNGSPFFTKMLAAIPSCR